MKPGKLRSEIVDPCLAVCGKFQGLKAMKRVDSQSTPPRLAEGEKKLSSIEIEI
jgi:hypothetical protein